MEFSKNISFSIIKTEGSPGSSECRLKGLLITKAEFCWTAVAFFFSPPRSVCKTLLVKEDHFLFPSECHSYYFSLNKQEMEILCYKFLLYISSGIWLPLSTREPVNSLKPTCNSQAEIKRKKEISTSFSAEFYKYQLHLIKEINFWNWVRHWNWVYFSLSYSFCLFYCF